MSGYADYAGKALLTGLAAVGLQALLLLHEWTWFLGDPVENRNRRLNR